MRICILSLWFFLCWWWIVFSMRHLVESNQPTTIYHCQFVNKTGVSWYNLVNVILVNESHLGITKSSGQKRHVSWYKSDDADWTLIQDDSRHCWWNSFFVFFNRFQTGDKLKLFCHVCPYEEICFNHGQQRWVVCKIC